MYVAFYDNNTIVDDENEETKRLFCCKCTQTLGAVRSDWLQDNSTYQGIYIHNIYTVNSTWADITYEA